MSHTHKNSKKKELLNSQSNNNNLNYVFSENIFQLQFCSKHSHTRIKKHHLTIPLKNFCFFDSQIDDPKISQIKRYFFLNQNYIQIIFYKFKTAQSNSNAACVNNFWMRFGFFFYSLSLVQEGKSNATCSTFTERLPRRGKTRCRCPTLKCYIAFVKCNRFSVLCVASRQTAATVISGGALLRCHERYFSTL